MKTFSKSALLAALLFVTACKKENINKTDVNASQSLQSFAATASSGTADFSTYIAIGDSQSAGYANDGLYNAGMVNSFPNIIASKLKALGLTAFNQPLFSTAQENGTGALKLTGITPDGFPITSRETTKLGIRGSIKIPGFGTVPLLSKYTGLNNNFGIVGLRVADITNPAMGNVNSYFERLLTGDSPNNSTSYIDFATANPFSFFTLNLGGNDVLGFGLQGGADVNRLTDKVFFNTQYELLVSKLIQNGAKGVLTTVPDIHVVPFFNAIKVPDLIAKASAINPAFNTIYINARKSTTTTITTYAVRAAAADDLFLLTFDATKLGTLVNTASGPQPYGLSPLAPIENQWVLDSKEALIALQYTNTYNTAIKNIAATNSLALCDLFAYYNSIKNGTVVQGLNLSAAYVTGGLFSLDGIHLTPRGNALLANKYIAVINAKYGSTIKAVALSGYSAN